MDAILCTLNLDSILLKLSGKVTYMPPYQLTENARSTLHVCLPSRNGKGYWILLRLIMNPMGYGLSLVLLVAGYLSLNVIL